MLDSESLLSGKPVPPVGTSDVKRVWELTSEARSGERAPNESVGFCVRSIAGQCSQGADPLAVLVRVALLSPLLESGLLDEWRDGERPHHVVFQTLATFPLPEGIQRFRSDEFIDTLRRAR